MAIIKLGKKKEEPCCEKPSAASNAGSGSTAGKSSRFIVLGACCQKSTDTFNNVKQAVKELDDALTKLEVQSNG
jgi:hypothetical protein